MEMPYVLSPMSYVLKMRNEMTQARDVSGICHHGAAEALLPPALLHQKMIAAVALEREAAASGHADAFLRAAVRFQLRHEITINN